MNAHPFQIIGLGPGGSLQLTLHAVQALSALDVLWYPENASGNNRALELAKMHTSNHAICLPLPLLTDKKSRPNYYRIYEYLIDYPEKKIGFVCLGDPLLYGSGVYIMQILQAHGCPFEVVSGLTSVQLMSARLGTALVVDDEVLTIATCKTPIATLKNAIQNNKCLVLMKPCVSTWSDIYDLIERSGALKTSFCVQNAHTRPIISSIEAMRKNTCPPYFSILLVSKNH